MAADVAIHAPHPAGDQRNHHAHVLTTTRAMEAEGLGKKTRVLDVATSLRGEVTAMRALWCGLQNAALELAERERGLEEHALDRVDPRTLAAQREEALARGDALRAEELDRAPEVKLGPVVSGVERRAQREAEAAGVAYEPVTERGARVHEARRARALFAEMRAGLEAARERARELGAEIGAGAWEAASGAREAGRGAWASGWSALRGAAARLWGGDAEQRDGRAAEERFSVELRRSGEAGADRQVGEKGVVVEAQAPDLEPPIVRVARIHRPLPCRAPSEGSAVRHRVKMQRSSCGAFTDVLICVRFPSFGPATPTTDRSMNPGWTRGGRERKGEGPIRPRRRRACGPAPASLRHANSPRHRRVSRQLALSRSRT